MRARAVVYPLLLVLLVLITSAYSWKKEEFRNCNQTPFCKSARSRKPGSCNLRATHVSISDDGDLIAKLVPKQEEEDPNNELLLLTLSVYQDGVMRLKIDEHHPPKKRFEVPDVIEDDFLNTKLWLTTVKEEQIDGSVSSVVYLSDGYEGVLRHDPFEVFAREKGSGKRVLSINSNGLFHFEQLRDKKEEGDDWEEKFRSHTDTRPYGPQSISFDVSFYGADFVYGIPEHATSLALKPTRGANVDEFSEPYRLFNLDVFEYLHESPFGLYGSIPFMSSHGKARGSSGFFWLNAAEMQIDVFGAGWNSDEIMLPSDKHRIDTLWMSEAGVVDTFFFIGPGPKDVVREAELIPPRENKTRFKGGGITHVLLFLEISKSWLSQERNTQLMREAIHVRYMYLPYFYTLFREANSSGTPVARPLWMEFPGDEKCFSNDEAFMVGNGLLVQGVYTERAKHVSVYLPGEESWYDLRSASAYKGGHTHKYEVSEDSVPSFQRAGTIIPRKDRLRRSSTQMENDPYTLVIALNSAQAAEGELYIDDGKSFEFKQGAFIHRRFTFSNGKLISSNAAPSTAGSSIFSSECTLERIILLGLSPGAKTALIEPGNKKVEIELGPLFIHGNRASVLTIRKPNVRITNDWSIQIL
ncbi:probable glucan 1,3-alpha-glucosidase [Lycium barbarum]|uniref:probable glucan 1,3-alpha-glucosidase n=1 Tax=Lycium barbarum TaxID=112863 RepID=UPI00293F4CB0|nr:probable glucan 1,3-alpha-glucosidase [Lycium barbarum]